MAGQAAETAPPTTGPIRPRNRYAWALAGSPLLGIVLVILLAAGIEVPSFVSYAGVGLAVALGFQDAAEVRAAGGRMSNLAGGLLSAFLAVIYLIVRAVRVRGGYALPVAWCAAAGATIASALLIPSDAGFDRHAIEPSILEAYTPDFGPTLQVTCPQLLLVNPGDQMRCTITAGGTRSIVQVTLDDTAGNVSYLLLP